MPGKKDCASVRRPQGQVTMQKRLFLTNLWKLYCLFKDRHPEVKVAFSKFAELRPPHCVLTGASGTHSVCVCALFVVLHSLSAIHQCHHATLENANNAWTFFCADIVTEIPG